MEKTGPRFHYAWVMVAGCLLMTGACVGVISNSMSVFVKPVCEAFDVTRARFTLYSTFSSFGSMLTAPLIGRWFERRPLRPTMLVGALAMSAGVFGYSFASEVWHFYIVAAVIGVSTGLCGTIAVAKLLSNWFAAKKGLAMGVSLSGSGLAASLMVPIVNASVQAHGWQSGFRVMGTIFFFMTVPTILLILRDKPADKGLLPYGVDERAPEPTLRTGFTRDQATHCSAFWFFGAATFLTSFVGMGTQAHVIAYLSDIGYSSDNASAIYAGTMAVLIAGKILLGCVYDKYGIKVGAIYGSGLFAASLVLLIFARLPFAPKLFVVTFGLSNAIQTVQRTYIVNRLFGDLYYSSIYGLMASVGMAGSAIAVPFSGWVYDHVGTYLPAWYGYIGICAAVVVLIFAADREAAKRRCELGLPVGV
ncbi:MAG TPA: MFS transporter [Candidatus Acidoferrum sp.]|nr:MFS transporter [Candidatus Acidoferrum sp.]